MLPVGMAWTHSIEFREAQGTFVEVRTRAASGLLAALGNFWETAISGWVDTYIQCSPFRALFCKVHADDGTRDALLLLQIHGPTNDGPRSMLTTAQG